MLRTVVNSCAVAALLSCSGLAMGQPTVEPPCWVACKDEPGWWDSIFSCKVCSPGYSLGTHCFDSGFSVACGGTQTLTISAGVSLGLSVECGDAELSVEVEVSGSHSVECTAPACGIATLKLCFPNSQVKVWQCERKECTAWEWVDRPVTGPCRRCVQWKKVTYFTTEFIPGGAPIPTCANTDASCFCKDQGHDCECDEDPDYDEPDLEPQPGDGAVVEWLGAPLQDGELVTTVTFHVDQFEDSQVKGVHLSTLDDLSMYHLVGIAGLIESALERSNDPESVVFTVLFEDGGKASGRLLDLEDTVEFLAWDKATSAWSADFNADGTVDGVDLALLQEASLLAQTGVVVPSYYDLDGDGLLTADDCQIVGDAIVELGKPAQPNE
ncbi:MAG: dockerin type I domain-containing protein [Phycisphaerales bacterium]